MVCGYGFIRLVKDAQNICSVSRIVRVDAIRVSEAVDGVCCSWRRGLIQVSANPAIA